MITLKSSAVLLLLAGSYANPVSAELLGRRHCLGRPGYRGTRGHSRCRRQHRRRGRWLGRNHPGKPGQHDSRSRHHFGWATAGRRNGRGKFNPDWQAERQRLSWPERPIELYHHCWHTGIKSLNAGRAGSEACQSGCQGCPKRLQRHDADSPNCRIVQLDGRNACDLRDRIIVGTVNKVSNAQGNSAPIITILLYDGRTIRIENGMKGVDSNGVRLVLTSQTLTSRSNANNTLLSVRL